MPRLASRSHRSPRSRRSSPRPVAAQQSRDLSPYLIADRAAEVALARSSRTEERLRFGARVGAHAHGLRGSGARHERFHLSRAALVPGRPRRSGLLEPEGARASLLQPAGVAHGARRVAEARRVGDGRRGAERDRGANQARLRVTAISPADSGRHGVHALPRAVSRRRQPALDAARDVLLRSVVARRGVGCGRHERTDHRRVGRRRRTRRCRRCSSPCGNGPTARRRCRRRTTRRLLCSTHPRPNASRIARSSSRASSTRRASGSG